RSRGWLADILPERGRPARSSLTHEAGETPAVRQESVDESNLRPELAPAFAGDAGLVGGEVGAAEGRGAALEAEQVVGAERGDDGEGVVGFQADADGGHGLEP